MAAKPRHTFSLTGPKLPTLVDWSNSYHRRAVVGSLVQGVNVQEHDRREGRQGSPQALAPPWWLSFNFRLVHNLIDTHDQSYFGAVFQFTNSHNHNHSGPTPPHYVIAFRGTIRKRENLLQDLSLNFLLLANNSLQNRSRVKMGLETARHFVLQVGPANVWLAGHSLGAALALQVGRHMAKHDGALLETYLFNPPFPSLPIEKLPSNTLKRGLRLGNTLLTAALASALDHAHDDPFAGLSTWTPYLFINPSDPICSEYVGYFKIREDMESIGAAEIGRLATRHSKRSILLSFARERDCEAVHLIPSASLTIISTTPKTLSTGISILEKIKKKMENFKEAHGIHQWLSPDVQFDHENVKIMFA